MKPRSLASLLLAGGLAGCATTYGSAVGGFGRIEVRASSPIAYRIVRSMDFETAFPDKPLQIDGDREGLIAFLAPRPTEYANQGDMPYRSGRFYLSYRCGNVVRFKRITIGSGPSVQVFPIGCE